MSLTAISPIDGRYNRQTRELSNYFSEAALIKYRVRIEVEYFLALCRLPLPQLTEITDEQQDDIKLIFTDFTIEDAATVKNYEATTNHDVKAVEYLIKEKFEKLGLANSKEFIHFGLTSQDINNTAIPLLLKECLIEEILPLLNEVSEKLLHLSQKWQDVSMLARTHGQPASPTRLGKEIKVFAERLNAQVAQMKAVPFSAKFGGATGNFNAHQVAYPNIDWISIANDFINNKLGLHRSQTTTQVEHYDNLAAIFDALKRINTIFVDLNRDIWMYISMNYFKQQIKPGEVGSSAMPHKVNPIDFENSEGNLGIANALLEHLAAKLPVSRLQRDLTDSTVMRNIGVPLAHSFIAYKSLLKGLDKLLLNQEALNSDLENNWAVVAEAIQTILRREGYPNPYEALKSLTRTNESITRDSLHHFIDNLEVSDMVKQEMKAVTPQNYVGIASI